MPVVEISKIQVRRGQENQTGVPVLDSGELGWASDTENLYIGLRRVDGGSRDANVRILTENDLRNLFRSARESNINLDNTLYTFEKTTGITSSTWVPGQNAFEYYRTLQQKLDDFANVKDFGAQGDGTTVDTSAISIAVRRLFDEPGEFNNNTASWRTTALRAINTTTEVRKTLYFPAGIYVIHQTIPLPRGVRIVGDGMNSTIIRSSGPGFHFFETIDGAGVSFDTAPITMGSALPKPQYISIEKITLDNPSTATTGVSMLSLDNTAYTSVKDVRFSGGILTTASIIISSSTCVAIDIRGNNTTAVEHISIENCVFTGLNSGIVSRYNIYDIYINNCSFEFLKYGVNFNNPSNLDVNGPTSVKIENSRFSTIHSQGIYAGISSGTNLSAHIISSSNRFENVANFLDASGDIATTGTSIIYFGTWGNLSQNDYFAREKIRLESSNSSTYFPLIDGRGVLDYSIPITKTVGRYSSSTNVSGSVFYLPITGEQQFLTAKYLVYVPGSPPQLDRQGTLSVNVSSGNDPEILVSDNYHFNYGDGAIYDGPNGDGFVFPYEKRVTERYIRFWIYNPRPRGTNAEFSVTVSPYPYTGTTSTGSYSNVTLVGAGGQNYEVGDTIRIRGTRGLAGLTPLNDLIIYVNSIGVNNSLATFTWTGSATALTTSFNTTINAIVVTDTQSDTRLGGSAFGYSSDVYVQFEPHILYD